MGLVEPSRLPVNCSGYHWHVVPTVNGVATPVTSGCYSGYSDADRHQLGITDEPAVWVKQTGAVSRAVAWSPDGSKIVIGFDRDVSAGNYIVLVNASTGEREVLVGGDTSSTATSPTAHGFQYSAHALSWSPSGDWLAVGSDFVYSDFGTSTSQSLHI
eukprot:331935-Prymnesium_polylepis.1